MIPRTFSIQNDSSKMIKLPQQKIQAYIQGP